MSTVARRRKSRSAVVECHLILVFPTGILILDLVPRSGKIQLIDHR